MINAAMVGLGWWGRTIVESVQADSDIIRFVAGATRTKSPEVAAFAESQKLKLTGSVVRGKLGYQVLGGEPQFAGPGELVVWPAGTAHKWWNAGNDELHMSGWCRPPDNVEFYLSTLFASTKANGGLRPGLFDAAFLMTRYRAEFAMLELPTVARHVVIPVVTVAKT